GGSFSSEQNGAQIDSPSSLSLLLASVSTKVTGISINPVSNFINARTVGVLSSGGVAFKDALNTATTEIKALYGLTSNPGSLVPSYTAADIGKGSGNLGLILGAMINEDQLLCPSDPGTLAAALATDIADGVFDGKNAGTPIAYCGGNLPATAGSVTFEDALSGANDLQMATMGFIFGGSGNALTANGITASQLVGPVAAINQAIANTIPSSGNSFAPPAETASMNVERDDFTATLLAGGKVLMAGGFDEAQEVALSSTELYDPINNCFAGVAGTPCA